MTIACSVIIVAAISLTWENFRGAPRGRFPPNLANQRACRQLSPVLALFSKGCATSGGGPQGKFSPLILRLERLDVT